MSRGGTLALRLATMTTIFVALAVDEAATAGCDDSVGPKIGFSSVGAKRSQGTGEVVVTFTRDTFNHPSAGWSKDSGTINVICPGWYKISFTGSASKFSLYRVFGDKPEAHPYDETVVATPPTGGTVSDFQVYLYPRDFLTLKSSLAGTDLATVTFSISRTSV